MQLKLSNFIFLGAICSQINLSFGTPSLQAYWDKIDREKEEISRFAQKYRDNKIKDVISPFERLPPNLVPYRYVLELQPILYEYEGLERFSCPGKITIYANLTGDNTNLITLHSKEIDIHTETVTVSQGGNSIGVLNHDFEEEPAQEFYKITLEDELVPGDDIEIYIEFTAKIFSPEERLNGLYYSYFRDDDNQTWYLLGTQFESTYARLAFPHFDEPAMKAIFETSLIRHESMTSLSNQNITSSTPVEGQPGWIKDTFSPTKIMSSYLNAFTVFDHFDSRQASFDFYRLPVTIWAPAVLVDRGAVDLATDLSAKIMEFFEQHFEIDYTFDKMDKIAIPQFTASAMENWGLNMYKYPRLLWIENESTWADRVYAATIISHEIIHQWAGNLVTMEWWGDIWLNEGFANIYSPMGVNTYLGNYYVLEAMVVNSVQVAMQYDVGPNTRPIHSDAETPDEIWALFDLIGYRKGGSLLRMTQDFMEPANFRRAIINYLNEFAYKSVHQDDLFSHLAALAPEEIREDMQSIMESWTLKSGFPVIEVERINTNLLLTQKKYLGDENDDSIWWIPVKYITPAAIELSWLSPERISMEISNVDSWIIINPNQIGFYRVKYDIESLNRIVEELNKIKDSNEHYFTFDHQSRSALIDDNFNLAYDGYWPDLTQALELTTYMHIEDDLLPWTSLLTNLAYTHRMIGRKSAFYDFRIYFLSKITPALDRLGLDFGDTDAFQVGNRILLRTILHDWACNLGQSACINNAKLKFNNWMQNPEETWQIFPDLQPSIYCHAIGNGGIAEWDFAYERYLNFDRLMLLDVVQLNLIRALGCSNKLYILNRFLDMIIDPSSGIRSQHRLAAIQSVAANSAGTSLTWNFIRSNYEAIITRFGAGFFVDIVETLSSHFNNVFEKNELEAFIEGKEELEEFQEALQNYLKNIQKNVEWTQKHYSVLNNWLVEKNASAK